jgi:RNA polymerase sigma factor (sigma-70 family)
MQDGGVPVHNREGVLTALEDTDIAATFDQYSQVLHAYCLSQLGEHAKAGDVVQDTFIIASSKASGLSQPDRLRAWLFAVARNECHRRLQADVPSASLYEAAEAMDDTGQLSAITEQAEVRALVRAALAGLDPVDREIGELNLRYGLMNADLAAVLGVPLGQAHALASRASSRFEKSIGVLIVATSRRESCADLAAIMHGWRAKPTLLLRWRVKRHFKRCRACSEVKRQDYSPAMLLSILTMPPLPSALRERTLSLVADASPDAATYRAEVIDRAAPFGADGFPVQLTTSSVPRWRAIPVIAAAAVAATALALLGGGMYYVDYTSTHSASPAQPASAVASLPVSPRSARSTVPVVASTHPTTTPSLPSPTQAPPVVQPPLPTPALSPTHSASPTQSPSPTASP